MLFFKLYYQNFQSFLNDRIIYVVVLHPLTELNLLENFSSHLALK
jgi:hypothetical protein